MRNLLLSMFLAAAACQHADDAGTSTLPGDAGDAGDSRDSGDTDSGGDAGIPRWDQFEVLNFDGDGIRVGGLNGRNGYFVPGSDYFEGERLPKDVVRFFEFGETTFASTEHTLHAWEGAGWSDDLVDAGHTPFYDWEGLLVGQSTAGGTLRVVSALPPDEDECAPSCDWFTPTIWAFDGESWYREQDLGDVDGRLLAIATVGDALVFAGTTLWKWDAGTLTDVGSPFTWIDDAVGFPDGSLVLCGYNYADQGNVLNTTAVGPLGSTTTLDRPDGREPTQIAARATDDLFVIAGKWNDAELYHWDGVAWTLVPRDPGNLVDVAMDAKGRIAILARVGQGPYQVQLGTAEGVTVVWSDPIPVPN